MSFLKAGHFKKYKIYERIMPKMNFFVMFLGGQLGVVEICVKVEIVENNKDKHELYKENVNLN